MDGISERHRTALEQIILRYGYAPFYRDDLDVGLVRDLINLDKIINMDEPHDAITSRRTCLCVNRHVKQPLAYRRAT